MLDGEDVEMEIAVIRPMLHNRWAIIAPGLELISNIAGEIQNTFQTYAIFAAQHGCQRNYERKFREVINGGYSSERTREVFPED